MLVIWIFDVDGIKFFLMFIFFCFVFLMILLFDVMEMDVKFLLMFVIIYLFFVVFIGCESLKVSLLCRYFV